MHKSPSKKMTLESGTSRVNFPFLAKRKFSGKRESIVTSTDLLAKSEIFYQKKWSPNLPSLKTTRLVSSHGKTSCSVKNGLSLAFCDLFAKSKYFLYGVCGLEGGLGACAKQEIPCISRDAPMTKKIHIFKSIVS